MNAVCTSASCLAFVVLGAGLTACGSSSPVDGTTAATAPCRAADIALTESTNAGLGTTYDNAVLRNRDARACALRRDISASILDPRGRTVLTSGRAKVQPKQIILRHGQAALVLVGWGNWCRPAQGPFRLRLSLPGDGGRLKSGRFGPVSCSSSPTNPSGTKLSIEEFRRATKADAHFAARWESRVAIPQAAARIARRVNVDVTLPDPLPSGARLGRQPVHLSGSGANASGQLDLVLPGGRVLNLLYGNTGFDGCGDPPTFAPCESGTAGAPRVRAPRWPHAQPGRLARNRSRVAGRVRAGGHPRARPGPRAGAIHAPAARPDIGFGVARLLILPGYHACLVPPAGGAFGDWTDELV